MPDVDRPTDVTWLWSPTQKKDMAEESMTVEQGFSVLGTAMATILSFGGLIYLILVADYGPSTTPPSPPAYARSMTPTEYRQHVEAWETAWEARKSDARAVQEDEGRPNRWVAGGCLAGGGIGAILGLIVSIVGFIVWNTER